MSNVIQGSPEWFDMKRGIFSASRIVDICPGVKGSFLAGRKNYIAKVVLELITGVTAETYQSPAMEQGVEREAAARLAYEVKTSEWVDEVPFILHPAISRLGCSPDGLIGEVAGIEIKCPEPAQHLDTIINGTIKRDYIYQMQCSLFVTGREYWDFVSYNPDFPEHLQLYIHRVYPDQKIFDEIEKSVLSANIEVDELISKLEALK